MSREAMKLALEALEDYVEEYGPHEKDSGAAYVINALRQALETEQQPVAWTAMAFARLGEVRDKMRPDDVRIVQQFLDGDYTALEQTLEEKQEPVAWMFVNEDGECEQIEYGPVFDDPGVTPLYAAPPKREWVGLTDQEINSVCYKRDWTAPWTNTSFARAIEAKLKERNHG